jgi:hypothetical protein
MVNFGNMYFSLCCEKYIKSARIPKLFGVVDLTKAFLSMLVIISVSAITFLPYLCIFNST